MNFIWIVNRVYYIRICFIHIYQSWGEYNFYILS